MTTLIFNPLDYACDADMLSVYNETGISIGDIPKVIEYGKAMLEICETPASVKKTLYRVISNYKHSAITYPFEQFNHIIVIEDTGAGYDFLSSILEQYTDVKVCFPRMFNKGEIKYRGGGSLKNIAKNLMDTRKYLFIPDARNLIKTDLDLAFMNDIIKNAEKPNMTVITSYVGFEFLFVWSNLCSIEYNKNMLCNLSDYNQLHTTVHKELNKDTSFKCIEELCTQYSDTSTLENLSSAIMEDISKDSCEFIINKNTLGTWYSQAAREKIFSECNCFDEIMRWLKC